MDKPHMFFIKSAYYHDETNARTDCKQLKPMSKVLT